jgi:hypothetical protein
LGGLNVGIYLREGVALMKNLIGKRALIVFLALILLMGSQLPVSAATDWNTVTKSYNVKVFIDSTDNELTFAQDTGKPFIALDRTFVPYRVLGEALGATISWDNDTKKVTAVGNGNKVELFIGNKDYKVNDVSRTMDVEPFILASEGRTYIPARYITEGLNYTIDFTQKDGQMYVIAFTKGQNEAERKELLQELVAKEPTAEQKPTVIPVNSNQGLKQGDEGKTPPSPAGTYKQEGSHYTIYGSFDGVWETDGYEFVKYPRFIGTSGGRVSVVEIRVKGGSGKITCTSHPELNYMKKSSGYVQDRSAVSGYWSLMNHGYDIEVTKGMTIDLECSNGDTFTLTI